MTNEYELREKLKEEQGTSLDDLHETFRQRFLARSFLEHELGDKMRVSYPEMLKYYNEHIQDFDRPAQVSWREVVVEVAKNPDRVAARRKADAILQRLTRGEDFAAVARAESDGPNKADGGLWTTSPGSYAVEPVNAALERLETGQVSPVVEGPSSFHVVRVESRRAAGPAPFHEVQETIHRLVFQQKSKRQADAYFAKLRGQTVITTMFDGTASAPASTRDHAPDAR